MSVIKKCAVDGQKFELGHNGICRDGKYLCDAHAGVTRDAQGFAWDQEELERGYLEVVNNGEPIEKAYKITFDRS